MNARVGENITYQGGMLMENFYSKELDRTFEKVIFLEAVCGEAASWHASGALHPAARSSLKNQTGIH